MSTLDPRLRTAIRARLELGPATRLLAFGSAALDAADAARIAHLAAVGDDSWPDGAPSCTTAADPLRLPFVEALFDTVLVVGVFEHSDAPAAFLREVRRVIAPAGRVVLVVPRRWLSFGDPLPGQHYSRARLERLLVEAMFEPLDWQAFGGVHLVRAGPRGGAAMMPVGRGAARAWATAADTA